MTRVAVTGANGFLGRYVLPCLGRLEADVMSVVRSESSIPDVVSGKSVSMDILNPPVDAFNQLGKPDVLIHLAWGGLGNYLSLDHIDRELPGQFVFLRDLVRQGLKRVVCVGTCFEYGDQAGSLSESRTTNPNNPYGFAKDCLHKQLRFLQEQQSFELTWARFFYLYGTGQSPRSLFSQLCNAAQRGDQTFNMSGGEQLRDYLDVATATEYLVSLALLPSAVGTVNVCSGKPTSVRSLVECWLRQNGWSIDLNLGHYPYPEYEPFAFWGDNTKLLQVVGDAAIEKP